MCVPIVKWVCMSHAGRVYLAACDLAMAARCISASLA